MKLRKSRSVVRSALLAACAATALLMIAVAATAGTTASATSLAPGSIKAESAQVSVFGVDLRTDAADSLTGAKVTLNRIVGFTTGDLAAKTGATASQGVQLWQDTSTTGANEDVLDAGDTAVSTAWTDGGLDCSIAPTCTATLTVTPTALPAAAEGAYTFLIAIRTSNTIADGDTFTLALTTDAFTTSPANTLLTVPVTTPNIVADTVLPAAPNVSALGLSKAAGKVRVGGTAVSAENPGVLEVWHDGDAACASPNAVTESDSSNLTQTNADLVGTSSAQIAALQGVPAITETVCYRVHDAAGNVSPYVADGTVPTAPSAGDVALLGTANITNAKKVGATADGSPGRIFRLYLRPGGSGLERAKDENLVTPTFVQVTTASGVADSGTTNIRQFGNSSTLAANDAIAYSRVNAEGNDSAVTDDGAIPTVPAADELLLLSASAADDHQRVVADPDTTPGRIYGLYLDPAGLTSWQRAVTSSGGATPVRVTTASGSAASSTTQIFAGASQLTSGFATGYVRVDGSGNESGVSANGSIPTAPVDSNITFSDALNQFAVNPFPPGVAPLAVEIGVYAGPTAAAAYDGTPEGIASSTAPASVGELASGLNLYYSAVNTTTGNESGLTADGAIPAAPGGTDIGLLKTSAADGHRRVVADVDATPGQTYRLYLDTAGGSAWTRASTLSGGSTPVEVTTAAGQTSSGTTTIFAGTTALGGGHAVGYALVEGGNDSDATADGAIPAPPATSTTSLSDAQDKFTATAATSALRVNLHVNNPGDTASLAYDEVNGPDATATDATSTSFTDKDAGTTVFYTITDFATGNESVTVDDGDIPATPTDADVTLLGVSAAGGHQRVTATSDTSSRTFRLYLDALGVAPATLAVTSSGGSAPVEITTVNGSASSSPTTSIFAGSQQLAAGFAAGHARVSSAGNDSEVKADGAIPAVPLADTTSATAAIDEVTATSSSATNNINVYRNVSADPATAYDETPDVVLDADNQKPLDTSAGDRLYYTATDTTTRNESAILADGAIPAAPSATTSSASAASDTFVVPDATNANNVKIFLDPSSTPVTAYGTGVEDYRADQSPFPGAGLPAEYLYYTSLEVGSGNESAITSDGNIPNAPTGIDGVMSASAADQRISSSNDSSSRTVRLYGDPAGGIAYVAATTTALGSTPVEITTSATSQVVSAQGIYLSGSVLGVNASIAYSRVLDGNESDLIVDGSIPPAPAVDNFAADAADGVMTISSAAPNGTYRAFRGSTALSDRVTHTSGAPTAISVSGLVAGDVPGYALTGAAGNESPVLADGTIPPAPSSLALQAASDLGRLSDDRITSDATPTVDVSTTSGALATLFESATNLGTATADGSGLATITSSSLSDAPHTLKAKITVGGNTSPASGPLAVTIDTAAPAAPGAPDLLTASDSGSSSIDNVTSVTTPSFAVTVEGNANALLLAGASQVGSAIADGTGAATPASSTLTEGIYPFTVKAEDVAGNTSAASPALSVEIDTSAPAVSPSGVLQAASDTGRDATDKITSDTTPSLDVTGADPGASLVLRVGTTEIASGAADGSGNATLTSTALPDGTHDLTVSMVDPAGNISAPSSPVSVKVDTLAPAAPGSPLLTTDTGRSASDGVTQNATPTFAVVAEAKAIVEVSKGASVIGSATADGTGAASATVETLADGAHSLTAKATDEAGNVSVESPSTGIEVDTAAPAVPGAPDLLDASDSGVSSADQITNVDTPSFGVTVEPGADAVLYAGATQVASDVAGGTGEATLTSGALGDATYAITVKAVDAAGNATALSPELSVEIDTVAPAVSPAATLQAASDTGRLNTDGTTFDTTPSFDVTGGEAGGRLVLLKGVTELASGLADGSGNATLTSEVLAEGTHDVTAAGTDVAGNASTASAPVSLVVDTIAPEAPAAPALSSDTGRSLTDRITSANTPSFAVTTEALAIVELVEGGSSIGSATADGAGAASPAVGSALGDGIHSVAVKATDVAGNVSGESSATAITVDRAAPAAPASIDLQAASDTGSSATDEITNDNTPSFTVVFTEPNGLVKLYDDVTEQSVAAAGDASVAVTADLLGDGTHAMKATVSDVAGNESIASSVLSIGIDTVAPPQPAAPDLDPASDTGSNGTDNVTGDKTPTFNLSGYEAGTTLTLLEGATSRGTGVVGSGGNGSVTTSTELGEGLHSLAWSGADVAGNVSALSPALAVTIDTGAPSVVLTTTSALTGQFKAVFSENVAPVNASNVVLRVTGTPANLPATVAYDSASRTATLKTTSPLVAGQRYTFIIGPSGATKPADPAGSPVTATSPSVRASTLEQETSVGAKQQWAVVSNSAAYGGSYTTEHLNGATASLSFTGTSVTWYTVLAPSQGKARVLIDGVSKGDFDNYRSISAFRFPRSFSGLSAGPHTIKVIALGTKQPASSNTMVIVDAFKVGSTFYEHSSVRNEWQSVVASSASSGRYVRSGVAGSVFTFTFRGTGIDWATVLGPSMGKATVTIDGTSYGTVDNYASSFRFGSLRSYRGLTDGVHTIRIVVLGQRRSGATGTYVAADRFSVI